MWQLGVSIRVEYKREVPSQSKKVVEVVVVGEGLSVREHGRLVGINLPGILSGLPTNLRCFQWMTVSQF